MKTFNNICHYIIGFSFLHAIGNLTDWNEFDNYSKIIAVPVLSIIIGAASGFAIEWVQVVIIKKGWNNTDILRTTIGAFFGGLMSVFFPNLNLFMWISLGISASLILMELILILNKKQ